MTRTEVAIVAAPLSRAYVSPLIARTPFPCVRMFLLRARIKLLDHVLSQWRLVRAGGPARQTGARDTRSAPLMFARCARHSNWIRCCSPRIPEIFCHGHARRNSSDAIGPSTPHRRFISVSDKREFLFPRVAPRHRRRRATRRASAKLH